MKPKPLAIAERFRFFQRNKGKQETVSQYIAELRKLSEHCELVNSSIKRDRLVCGLSSVASLRKLLAEDKLDLKKAAISMELAENEARKLKVNAQDVHGLIMIKAHTCTYTLNIRYDNELFKLGHTDHRLNFS